MPAASMQSQLNNLPEKVYRQQSEPLHAKVKDLAPIYRPDRQIHEQT